MKKIRTYLEGGDLRSIAKVDALVPLVNNQSHFDQLFQLLFDENLLVVMRAADAVEKITRRHPSFLQEHKKELLDLAGNANEKELKWHLAQLLPRFQLSPNELKQVWTRLSAWASDPDESKIVRVNAFQSLYDLLQLYPHLLPDFRLLVKQLKAANVPSINARIRKLLD